MSSILQHLTRGMTKIIVTGGPCTGKTTMLEKLSLRGYQILPESARQILAEHQEQHGDIPDLSNKAVFFEFQEKVLARQEQLESMVQEQSKLYFLDRGALDGLGYVHARGYLPGDFLDKVEKQVELANYHYQIFLLDSLPFFHHDGIRRENQALVEEIQYRLEEVYEDFGFEVFRIPFMPVQKRADYLLETLWRWSPWGDVTQIMEVAPVQGAMKKSGKLY